MYFILLDDGFFENYVANRDYINLLVDFLCNYTNINFIFFHPFNQSKKSNHLAYEKSKLEKCLLSQRRITKFNLDEIVEKSDIDSSFRSLNFSDMFIGKIHYICSSCKQAKLIIPLCIEKHNLDLKVSKDYIFYINHYAKELNSNIATWIQEDNIVHIPFPDIQNIFPAHKLCYGYEELRSQILKSFDSKIKNSSFETIGIEVAARNRYNLDRKLSNKNSKICNSKRKVFISLGKDCFYISIDFENGGFEVYDKNKKYLGQYKFNGSFEKFSSPTNHKLY